MISCVHTLTPRIPDSNCGRPIATRSHGFLCHGHYTQQQNGVPAKPRFPWVPWIGAKPKFQTDDEIVADLIATDAALIAKAQIVELRFGKTDPAILRLEVRPSLSEACWAAGRQMMSEHLYECPMPYCSKMAVQIDVKTLNAVCLKCGWKS